MGLSPSLECCAPSPEDGEFRLQAMPQSLGQQHQSLRAHLRLINLLSALNFQIASLESQKIQVTEISNEFNLISRFIEMIEYEAESAFLNIIQSKTMLFEPSELLGSRFQALEVCILNISSIASQPALIANEVKQCFQILELLKLDQPLESYNPQNLLTQLVEELISIPSSDEYMWDLRIGPSLENAIAHLRYSLRKILPFVNRYLSLNDPSSYLHIRHLHHFLRHYLCQSSLRSRLSCARWFLGLKVQKPQKLLFSQGSILIVTNFLCFKGESAWGQENPNVEEGECSQVQLILQLGERGESFNAFVDRGNLYYLPFSMFSIRRLISRPSLTEVHLSELVEQTILQEMHRPLQKQQDVNHVLINQTNLLAEMKALRNVLTHKLESTIASLSLNPSTEDEKLVYDYYQSYNVRLGQHLSSLKLERDPLEQQIREAENEACSQKEESSKQETAPLTQVSNEEAVRLEKKLSKFMKQQKMEKLLSQICEVDRFFNLRSLNLSQSWLQKIEYLECFPNLTHLFLYSNEISTLEGLETNNQLQLLSLSRNRIRTVANIDHLARLRYIYLTKNSLQRDSAQYLCSLSLKNVLELSISFSQDPNGCFELLSERLPFRISSLVINGAEDISERTKNMLRKRLKKTSVTFVKG